MRVTLTPAAFGGTLAAPPSKSMAHRALICAALAQGESRVCGISSSEDMRATMRAMAALGAQLIPDTAQSGCVRVRGVAAQGEVGSGQTVAPECVRGVAAAHAPATPQASVRPIYTPNSTAQAALFAPVTAPVDCGESGSTLRFLLPLFSLTGAPATLTGHGRLPQRPQTVYEALFAAHGCSFLQNGTGITVNGALPAGEYVIDGSVSSQFISGLLFALPLLQGDSVVRITPPFESRSYVDLTVRALADFGITVTWQGQNTICISGSQKYIPCHYTVEGDYSQAAFFAVAAAAGALRSTSGFACAAATPTLTLTNLRADSLQGDRVIFDLLTRCGAPVARGVAAAAAAGGTDAVTIAAGAPLCGVDIDLADCPDLGPILMVLGLFCKGETVIRNAGRLRIKESDRIAAMECEIRKLGGQIESVGDTVRVRKSALHACAALNSHGDHRIVMALCAAALAAGISVTIDGAQAVNKSYPRFFEDLAALGAKVEKYDEAT